MVMRNLLKAAYEREQRGEPAPEPAPQPKVQLKSSAGGVRVHRQIDTPGAREKEQKPPAKVLPTKVTQQLEKLTSLRDQGILTDAEYRAARERILANV
jgi:hypothetical protein